MAHRAPARTAATRIRTRSRLVAALATLAVLLLAVVAMQLVALLRIERERAAAEDLEEEFLLADRFEDALRRQFAHQIHAAAGHPAHVTAYEAARRDVAAFARELSVSMRSPEAVRIVIAIEEAAGEIDRSLRLPLPPSSAAATSLATAGGDPSAALFALERNVERLFASLGVATAAHRDAVTRRQDALQRLTIALVLGTALLAVALTLYLSRSVARPLARLEAGAARIATGQLDARIDIRTHDEFGAVAAQLNVVAAHLQAHRERLSRAEALATVGRCTAAVVHELNSSLQVILGYLTLDRDRVPGELATHFQRIENEARRGTDIVSRVLAISRPPAAAAGAVDLRDVAEEVASAIRVLLPPGGPQISVRGAALAVGPRSGFHQILANLTKNAADAAGLGGRVEIRAGETEAEVRVEVDDTGPGVPPNVRELIFEPFFTTKGGGTGLGLSISRELAHGIGGDIEVGRGELGGARFTLRVPRRSGEA
jgi:signal transduction histidine kinase